MPLYLIERDFSSFTLPEIEAAAIRGRLCSVYFEGIRWVRSFFDESTYHSRCIYEAEIADQAREHAYACGMPCDQVRPVSEVIPGQDGTLSVDDSHGDGTPIRDDSGTESLWMARHSLRRTDSQHVIRQLGAHRKDAPHWVRSYMDAEAAELVSIYRGSDSGEASAEAHKLELPLLAFGPTIENIRPTSLQKPNR